MKILTEEQIIGLAKEFFQCEEGPEIGDVFVTDDLIKDFASELLALQGEPTKELCPICGRELTRTCFYCTKELCSPFNLQEKGEPTKDISDDMIEKWADNEVELLKDGRQPTLDLVNTIIICFRAGLREGAKALQSGEIARWAKENGRIIQLIEKIE